MLGPGGIITFDPSLSGATITLTSGTLRITNNLTIDGFGLAPHIRVSGNNTFTVFTIPSTYAVSISGLTIANGNGNGGGIYNYFGNLTVTDVVFETNHATNQGGGIYNYYGSLVVSSSTFSNNNATLGGWHHGNKCPADDIQQHFHK